MVTGHRVSVTGDAIINIDSVLDNTTQTINKAPALPDEKRQELSKLVAELKSGMDSIKANYAEECQELAEALEKAVSKATQPQPKKSMLELTAKGLKEAAEVLADVAPTILKTATKIATFIVGLV